jgi:hypothetical protein
VAVLHGGYPAWTEAGFPRQTSADGDRTIPAAVSCSGDALKSVEGAVTAYRRENGKTVLRIGTETITLPHSGEDPSRFFLVDGTPFAFNDWNRIEAKKGKVLPRMSAVAWMCTGGPTIVDWHPGKR